MRQVGQKPNADGVFAKHARIIRKLIPIRDSVREILESQETDQPWKQAQVRLRIAWSSFVRDFGPINTTVVSSLEDEESGEVRETHRRPNLAPFADDPDCWLVASIEDYDLETNTARPGPIFAGRVIAPPPAPERRVLNTVETEAAKDKLARIKTAFQSWIWSDPDRTDRLARLSFA